VNSKIKPQDTPPAEVIVRGLVKSYGQTQAVAGISFDVFPGEIFGLLGPNGAGKTTAIECLLGLRRADAGSITMGGFDAIAQAERIKQIIGAQLQATALQDKITPRQALNFFASFYRNAMQSDELLSRFGLIEKASAAFDTLSTGQRQRLALALAFVNDPKVLFLDEPTAGLDPQSRRDLHADILRLKGDGRTIILSTHYIEEAHQLCDRIAIMNAGRLVATGTPEELIAQANLPKSVTVKTAPMLDRQSLMALPQTTAMEGIDGAWKISTTQITRCVIGVVHIAETRGVELLDLQIHRPSLEDVFISLTGKSPIDS
jgi:ABC-2 type transport system ATP-binding protein